tara:strand:+ start:1483 stop:1698 length:216 start_codon:yes stop_codon:yes gene_type:complete
MGLFPNIMGVDEQALAYDITRAHSADIWFLKIRFYMWATILSVGAFLIGNILGAIGVNLFGELFEWLKHLV